METCPFPVEFEPGQDTVSIFSGVDTTGHSLFSWNSAAGQWMRMNKDTPLDPLTGMWIYAATPAAVPLPFATNNPEGNYNCLLAQGWNLISILEITESPVGAAFPDNLSWSYLLGFNAVEQRYTKTIEKGGTSRIR